jgi:hypothetical protein
MKIKNVNWIILIVISLDYTYDIPILFQEYNVYDQSINKQNMIISFYSNIYFQRKIDKVQSHNINNK